MHDYHHPAELIFKGTLKQCTRNNDSAEFQEDVGSSCGMMYGPLFFHNDVGSNSENGGLCCTAANVMSCQTPFVFELLLILSDSHNPRFLLNASDLL